MESEITLFLKQGKRFAMTPNGGVAYIESLDSVLRPLDELIDFPSGEVVWNGLK